MRITIEVVADLSATTPSNQGFLKMRRLRLRNRLEDGSASREYAYDSVDRTGLDAVVMVLHADNPDAPGDPLVLVRQALRPPLLLRQGRELPLPDARPGTQLWELPAGIIEPEESGLEGVLGCAARETLEETGYRLEVSAFQLLGSGVYLSPGICPEKVHLAVARIPNRAQVETATLDGSAVEEHAAVEFWPLSRCLAACLAGEIEDAKTEVALHRLAARLTSRA